jgi:Spy/CpxP family protein refolding chaperone
MLIRLLLIGALAAGVGFAQRGGGGGGDPTSMGDASGGAGGGGGSRGGGGGGGGMMPGRGGMAPLDQMAASCSLSKDQKRQFKTIIDAASKSAEVLRKGIPPSRAQIGAAIQAGRSADEIRKLVEANALMTAQMAEAEYKVFGQLYNLLDAEQKKPGVGARLLSQVNGILMKKNWEE